MPNLTMLPDVPLTREDVREILSHVSRPQKGTNSREYWLKVCAATCSALNGDEATAISLLEEWQAPWEKNAYENAIRSFGGNYKCTAGTLILRAKAGGYNASERAKERALSWQSMHGGNVSKNSQRQKRASVSKKDLQATGTSEEHETPLASVKLGECSFLADISKPAEIVSGSLVEYLQGIKSGEWREAIEKVRAGTIEKTCLPELNVFGVYRERRKDENLVSRSGFLVLDFDTKDNSPAILAKIRAAAEKLDFVLAAFRSPRNGLKLIVRVTDDVPDDVAFKELCVPVFAVLGGKLDDNAPAHKRCFVSDDSEAYINPAPIGEILPVLRLATATLETLLTLYADSLERVFSCGKDYLEKLANTFAKRSEAQAWRIFDNRGFPRERKGKLLEYIAKNKHLARIETALSGHVAGVYEENGERFAVCQSPHSIEPKPGEWKTIERLLKSRFDDKKSREQYEILLLWLQRSRERLRRFIEANKRGEKPPRFFVPGLILLGGKGLGKSALFDLILAPSSGNRFCDATKTLAQGARFNAAAKGSEILLVDDISEKDVAKVSRAGFADNVKKYCFGAAVGAESKGQDERTISGACFFFVQLANFDKIATTPDWETAKDKLLVFTVDEYEKLPEKTDEDFEKLNKQIEKELPAFLYWLDNEFVPEKYALPDESSREEMRVGMKLFVHPKARELLNESDPAENLLADYDARNKSDLINAYNQKLQASQIVEKAGARYSAQVASGYLRTLAEKYPERVENVRDTGGEINRSRGWIIHPPK